MTVRTIGHDQHYGEIGLGSMVMSAANTFSSAPVANMIEPDMIIKSGRGSRRVLDIDIDDVLVWDVKNWIPRMEWLPDFVAAAEAIQSVRNGLTRDNTSNQSNGPTAETIAEGVFPAGAGATVTGTAGVTGSAPTVGADIPDAVRHWTYTHMARESNAAGEMTFTYRKYPVEPTANTPYQVNGITCHQLLTANSYWMWAASDGIPSAGTMGLGANVRRMSIDLEEVLFDRAVLFSILDALTLTN